MFILIKVFIILSTLFPLFHLLNAIITRKKQKYYSECAVSEEKAFSILIPCYNEENTVRVSVKGLLAMDYKNYEAIYINDGSVDNTLKVLNKLLCLKKIKKIVTFSTGILTVYRSNKHDNFFVIDKSNGGKSAALNTGILLARESLVVTLDADSVLKKDALTYMNRAFETGNVVAAGGSIHIMQGYDPEYLYDRYERKRSLIVSLQILEYLKGFYIYKRSLSKQKATAIISGAFGVFRKEILLQAGGFRNSLGEDIDITMRIQQLIQKRGQKVLYLPEALCYTQCPENWHDLRKQRLRWQKGFIDCALYQRTFLAKTFLFRTVSFHFLVEAVFVGMCSCLFVIFSHFFVVILTFVNIQFTFIFLVFFALFLVFNVIYSISAVAVSVAYNPYPRVIMRKIILAIIFDIFVYRYFTLTMYLGGTFLYFWNSSENNCWNKFARSRKEFFFFEAEEEKELSIDLTAKRHKHLLAGKCRDDARYVS